MTINCDGCYFAGMSAPLAALSSNAMSVLAASHNEISVDGAGLRNYFFHRHAQPLVKTCQ
jgi:hypothetical protein